MSCSSFPSSTVLAASRRAILPRPAEPLIDRLIVLYQSNDRLATRLRAAEAGIEAVQLNSFNRGSKSALNSACLAQLTATRREIAVELANNRFEATRLCIP